MAIKELSVIGYRSVRQIRLKLERLNLIGGPNGCGKSNLYNVMPLLSGAAKGDFAKTIAGEGGMPSVLWAGVQKRFGHKPEPRRMKLAIRIDAFNYELQCGLPQDDPPQSGLDANGLPMPVSQFLSDPEIIGESVWMPGPRGRRTMMMDRQGTLASIRGTNGKMASCRISLNKSESVLPQIQEPHLYPELSELRSEISRWRFYHHFRTDVDSPLRHPRFGVLTPVLSRDGADLAGGAADDN